MSEQYDFDVMADRSIDHARKWDPELIAKKFPGARKDFIPMWIADMDFPTSPAIRKALVQLSDNGAYGYTYAHSRFYEAIINWQKRRHGNEVRREWIINSYGTVPTIHYLYQAFCQANDYVILNTPVYDPFGYAAENNGLRVLRTPLIYRDQRYSIDYDLLEEQMERYHPRVHLFCSPHNPGGRIWSLEEIQHSAEICHKHNCLFVVDEVHSEHVISGEFISALHLPAHLWDNLVVLTSPNKGFNLGGLKTSYAIVPNASIRDRLAHRFEMNSITSPNVFGSAALIAAYDESEEWLDQITDYLRESYTYMSDFITKKMPSWKLMTMEASYLPWVDIADTGYTATEITTYMSREAGVIVGDGTYYVDNGAQFIRLNLGMPRKLVTESMERMARCQLAMQIR